MLKLTSFHLLMLFLHLSSLVCFQIRTSWNARNHFPLNVAAETIEAILPKQAISSNWVSAISTDTDIELAVNEIVDKISSTYFTRSLSDYTLAIFFVSSIYDSFTHSEIYSKLKTRLPGLKTLIGCTTGAVVGPLDPSSSLEPSEMEGRASIGITLIAEQDIQHNLQYLDTDQVKLYISDKCSSLDDIIRFRDTSKPNSGPRINFRNSFNMIISTESVKSSLGDFASSLKNREDVECLGVVASGVTSLHVPKILASGMSAECEGLERLTTGLVLLTLSGNIGVKTVVARSCLPIGPVFRVTKSVGGEILVMSRVGADGTETDELSPLVHLDSVLQELPTASADALKRELLLGVLPEASLSLSLSLGEAAAGTDRGVIAEGFVGQKPTAFDPITGSVSIPSLPSSSALVQFCIRDAAAARQDAQKALRALRSYVDGTGAGSGSMSGRGDGSTVQAVLMLGSMERGNRVFRYQSWEASQLHFQLRDAGLGSVPVLGMFTAGSVSTMSQPTNPSMSTADEVSFTPVQEADSMYAVITTRPATAGSTAPDSTASQSVSPPALESLWEASTEDIMTPAERLQYDDTNDGVIISKRDADSSHAVRVAGMDYFVAEKLPQPKNVLESLVWDREKVMDTLREKLPMTRALMLAKAAEKKYGGKSLRDSIASIRASAGTSAGGPTTPPIILMGMRGSPYSSTMPIVSTDPTAGYSIVRDLASASAAIGAAAVGYNVDSSSFGGSYEDLTALKGLTKLPVICDDFLLYGYQLFRAKAAGADVVKILASVVPAKDITYLIKTATALSLSCMVVVSSKVQLLAVLSEVPNLDTLVVTSRNMRLWKIDAGKADRIFADAEVKAAIEKYNADGGERKPLLLVQEGFSDLAELERAAANGVEAVLVGEELLRTVAGKSTSWWERLPESVMSWGHAQ